MWSIHGTCIIPGHHLIISTWLTIPIIISVTIHDGISLTITTLITLPGGPIMVIVRMVVVAKKAGRVDVTKDTIALPGLIVARHLQVPAVQNQWPGVDLHELFLRVPVTT